MKRIMNQKLITIFAGAAVVMAVLFVIFGIVITNNLKGAFQADGYVLGEVVAADGNSSNNIYFDANSKYQSKYPNKISLKGEKGKSTISKYSFVHYSNNDLSSFAKGVFVNLDELSNENLNYYNIPAEVVVKNTGRAYTFKVSSKEQRMSNFLWKIEENKYMVVSTDITAHIADGKDKKLENYVEFEYQDKGVVQLSHRDGTYQTISSDASIILGNGAVIMLNDRSIYLGEDKKMSLDQMVINADDNINIDDKEESTETTNNTTNNNNSSTTISGGGSSGGGTTPTETVTFPSFAVTSMEVGTVSISAQIEITDDDDLLTDDGVKVSIVEQGTDKTVWSKDVSKGQYQISVNYDNLNPDKEYLLVANASYEYKGEKYNKDFVSQLFRTNSTGIRMTKVKVDNSSIVLNINARDYSEITTVHMNVIDTKTGKSILEGTEAEEGKTINVSEFKGASDGKDFEFKNLNSDREYKVTLFDFYTGASTLPEENNIERSYTTLKETPAIGVPDVTVNKADSAFSLFLKNIDTEKGSVYDPDNGIEKMIFEIYESSQITVVDGGETIITGDPVYTAENKKTSGISVKIDNTVLKRNVTYIYRAIAIFNDNEKVVELNTSFSGQFSMTSAEYPSVTFKSEDIVDEQGILKEGIEHDSFRGVVTIHDNGNVVVRPNRISYSITGNDGGDVQIRQWDILENGELTTPVEVTGLRSNTTYTVTFTGMADLHDGNDPMVIYLGSFQVTTKKAPNAVKAAVEVPATAEEMDVRYAFNAQLSLGSKYEYYDEEKGATVTIDPSFEMSTMDSVQLVLYNGIDDGHGNISKGAQVGSTTLANAAEDVKATSYKYNSTLRAQLSEEADFNINPTTFGLTNDMVTNNTYVLEVTNAKDYTDFPNDINIIGDDNGVAEFVIQKHGFVPSLPELTDDALYITEVLYGVMQEPTGKSTYKTIASSGAADESLGLKSDTIVGYSVWASSFSSDAVKYAKSVTYKMYKLTNYISESEVELSEDNLVASSTITVPDKASTLPAWEVPIMADNKMYPGAERGNLYVFTYEVKLDLSEGGGKEIVAYYPKNAEGGEDVVLRSVICPCPKETPSLYMYLKNTVSNASNYNMEFRYKYSDVDNAYIVDKNNKNRVNDFIINNGTTSLYNWNEDDGSSSNVKKISLAGIKGGSNTLSISKKMSRYNKIQNYSEVVNEEEYTVQPMSLTKNTDSDIQGIKFHMDVDVSDLLVVLDPESAATHMSKIAAVKVKLSCQGEADVTFNYLTLDANNTAHIPLVRIPQFRKKEITVSVTAYYENDEIGTDIVSRSGNKAPVILMKYNRGSGYAYYNGTIKESLYYVQQDLSSSVLSGNLKGSKYFTANKLKNEQAVTNYDGDAESTFKYTVDSQGLDTSVTGNNYNIDTYYITRRVDTTSLSPKTAGADKITFSYIRPVVKNVDVEQGVVDAKVTFDYVDADKSTPKDNKLYLVLRKEGGSYNINDASMTYEIDLNSVSSKTGITVDVGTGTGKASLEPGKTYYFAIFGKFEDDGGTVDTLRLVSESGDEYEGEIIALGDVGFSSIVYSYGATSYNKKDLTFSYSTKIVSGVHIIYSLQDVTDPNNIKDIDITGYERYDNLTPDTVMRLPVGFQGGLKSNTAIPGVGELVYGNKYKLTAVAYTNSNNDSVGSKTVTFTLMKLSEPTITAVLSPTRSGGKDMVSVRLVVRDNVFSVVNQTLTVKFYEGRLTDTSTVTPIKTETVAMSSSYTYKTLTLGPTNPVLKQSTSYTMVVEGNVDSSYSGSKYDALKKTFYVKTLNSKGIGYSDVFAKSNDAGDVVIEFYDVQGFTQISSMQYTIYANTSTSEKPISGTVTGSAFKTFSGNNRRVTLSSILQYHEHDRYTIVMQLIGSDGSILVEENSSFSY